MTTISGAQSLIKALEYEGVDVAFGVPAERSSPSTTPPRRPIRHILARHEQGAGHMAEGYAWATGEGGRVHRHLRAGRHQPGDTAGGRPGRLGADRGHHRPGPHLAVGNDAFQEAYTTGITMPATKHNYFVTDPDDIPDIVHEAFHIAATGRPGPVLIDLPKDILNAPRHGRAGRGRLPGYKPTVDGHVPRIREAADLIERAQRPVLYVGGGIIKANAAAQLRSLAERTATPVTTTLMGRGAFPDAHPLALGMPGMHGTYAAITALQRADLIVAVGVRFDDRVTGDPEYFAPEATVIHVDVDPAEIGKVRHADVPIVGDAGRVIEQMLEAWGDRQIPEREAWLETMRRWQRDHPLRYRPGPRRAPQAAVCDRGTAPAHRRRRHRGGRGGPAPDVGQPVLEVRGPPALDQLGRPRNDGVRRPRRHRGQGGPARRAGGTPSTATAASR
jgi:acetolactate synthase I/II/III large subunit